MNVLLICWLEKNGISAVREHVTSIKEHSRNNVEIFNIRSKKMKIHRFFKKKLSNYDAIILHNTVTYDPQSLLNINNYFSPSLSEFSGVKVLMKQDEMRKINATKQILKDWKFDVLTTCLDKDNAPKVYDDIKGLSIIHTLTGYLGTSWENVETVPFKYRKWDVVYRGMETPFEWGSLGYEKFYIGEEFKKRCSNTNLRINISSLNQDRIYGNKWFEFLSTSRATLAVESGASIFDFTGDVERECKGLKARFPQITFQEVYEILLKDLDGNISYNQLSPRHLEAVILGTVQIMFDGQYSGFFIPDRHYIPLKKDFSNFEEVIKKLMDDDYCEKIIKQAREEILSRAELKYPYLASLLDDAIEKAIKLKRL